MLYLYSINCKFLSSVELVERITHMITTRDSEYLICGGEKGHVVIRTLHNLCIVHKFAVNNLTCLAMTTDERHLLVGCQDGKLLILNSRLDDEKNIA